MACNETAVLGIVMTNDELSAAIGYAFQCCDRTYVGGYTTGTAEEPGKVMLAHMKELLAVQLERAKQSTGT